MLSNKYSEKSMYIHRKRIFQRVSLAVIVVLVLYNLSQLRYDHSLFLYIFYIVNDGPLHYIKVENSPLISNENTIHLYRLHDIKFKILHNLVFYYFQNLGQYKTFLNTIVISTIIIIAL